MPSLIELQRDFAADLWDFDANSLHCLIADDDLPAARRFNVYRNNFRISLTEALADLYPVVQQLVGTDFFEFLADRYIASHPSRSGNLHGFGHALADFIGDFRPVSHLPYLADVARLEWAYHVVFHAPAPGNFDPGVLHGVSVSDYANLRFELGPACRLLYSPFPILRIWAQNQSDNDDSEEINLNEGPDSILIVRRRFDVEFLRLDAARGVWLSALRSGRNLGQALDAALALAPDFDLERMLGSCVRSGILVVADQSEHQAQL